MDNFLEDKLSCFQASDKLKTVFWNKRKDKRNS